MIAVAQGARPKRGSRGAPAALLVAVLFSATAGGVSASRPARAAGEPRERFDVVVIDAGHGGQDEGAVGPGGLAEKDLVLDVARRLAALLRKTGLRVVLTRSDDTFVPLETRTSVANDARADLFVSIHANAARSAAPQGIETYFVSLEASDESARLLAKRENDAFGGAAALSAGKDPLVALLGDMIATEHVVESSEFAGLAQAELAGIAKVSSRGVKQAPFVVLMGVQMPATLVEIGFITNPEEERDLRSSRRRDATAAALARAIAAFGQRFDARRGVARASATD